METRDELHRKDFASSLRTLLGKKTGLSPNNSSDTASEIENSVVDSIVSQISEELDRDDPPGDTELYYARKLVRMLYGEPGHAFDQKELNFLGDDFEKGIFRAMKVDIFKAGRAKKDIYNAIDLNYIAANVGRFKSDRKR